MAVTEPRTAIYEGTRIPSPIPSILQVDPALREEDDILESRRRTRRISKGRKARERTEEAQKWAEKPENFGGFNYKIKIYFLV